MEGQVEGYAGNQAAPIQVQSVSANVVYDAQGNAYQLVPVQSANNNVIPNANINNHMQNSVPLQVQNHNNNNTNYNHIPNTSHSNINAYSTDRGIPMGNANNNVNVNPSAPANMTPYNNNNSNMSNQYTTDGGPVMDNPHVASAPNAPMAMNVVHAPVAVVPAYNPASGAAGVSSVSSVGGHSKGVTVTRIENPGVTTSGSGGIGNTRNNSGNNNGELILGCIPSNYYEYDEFLIKDIMPYTNSMTGIIGIEYVILMICMYSFVDDYASYFWFWLGFMGMISCLYLTFQYFKYLQYRALKYNINRVKDVNFPLLPQKLAGVEIALRIVCLFIHAVSLVLILPNLFALPFTVWVLMPMCLTYPKDPSHEMASMWHFMVKFRIVPNYQAQKEFILANVAR